MVGKEYWRALVHEHSLDPSSFAISGSCAPAAGRCTEYHT
jgi:hypothetical protein